MLYVADILEEIYTNKDFPDLSNNNHQVPSLSVSMQESGKSRADLWAFATLIAAQMGVEQNNLACRGETSSKNQFIINPKSAHKVQIWLVFLQLRSKLLNFFKEESCLMSAFTKIFF